MNSVRLDILEHPTEETVSLPVYRAEPDSQACAQSDGMASTMPDYILQPPPAYARAKPTTNTVSSNQ